ncbi:MAG: MFS transporter [Chloroflexi bacterium]|nr:MFS transporter [Chloroflexota bacterium]
MNRDLRWAALALFLWGLGEGLFYHFQPLYMERLGASPESMGRILGFAGLLMTVSHLPIGWLVDRWDPRPLMWAGWAVGTLGGWVMALANQLSWFVLGLWLYATSMFVMVPMNTYLTAARGRWTVARVLTTLSALFNLGMIFGPWLGARLAARWGLPMVYRGAAGLFTLSTLAILQVRAHVREETRPRAQTAPRPRTLPKGLLAFAAFVALALFLVDLPHPLLPKFLKDYRGLDVQQIGELGSAYALGSTLIGLTIGRWPAGLGLGLTLLAQALASATILFLTTPSLYLAAYFLFGALRPARSLVIAQTRAFVPPQSQGLAYGLLETTMGLSTALAAALAGWMYPRWPTGVFWLAIVGGVGSASVWWAWWLRHRNRPSPIADPPPQTPSAPENT